MLVQDIGSIIRYVPRRRRGKTRRNRLIPRVVYDNYLLLYLGIVFIIYRCYLYPGITPVKYNIIILLQQLSYRIVLFSLFASAAPRNKRMMYILAYNIMCNETIIYIVIPIILCRRDNKRWWRATRVGTVVFSYITIYKYVIYDQGWCTHDTRHIRIYLYLYIHILYIK